MNKNKQKLFFILAFILLIVFGVYRNSIKNDELENRGLITEGVIVEFKNIHMSTYKIVYKFNVNHVDYRGDCRVDYFECADKTKGCVGKKFKIVYSKSNPEINEIDLGKYNRFKKASPSL